MHKTLILSGWRESQKGGIFGTYKPSAGTGGGSFAFAPAKVPEGGKPVVSKKEEQLIKQLENMGFPTWICKQAIEVTQELESAIEVCFSLTQSNGNGSAVPQQQEGILANAQGGAATQDFANIVEKLVDLGFSQEQATSVAKRSSSVEDALEILFSQN